MPASLSCITCAATARTAPGTLLYNDIPRYPITSRQIAEVGSAETYCMFLRGYLFSST